MYRIWGDNDEWHAYVRWWLQTCRVSLSPPSLFYLYILNRPSFSVPLTTTTEICSDTLIPGEGSIFTENVNLFTQHDSWEVKQDEIHLAMNWKNLNISEQNTGWCSLCFFFLNGVSWPESGHRSSNLKYMNFVAYFMPFQLFSILKAIVLSVDDNYKIVYDSLISTAQRKTISMAYEIKSQSPKNEN